MTDAAVLNGAACNPHPGGRGGHGGANHSSENENGNASRTWSSGHIIFVGTHLYKREATAG